MIPTRNMVRPGKCGRDEMAVSGADLLPAVVLGLSPTGLHAVRELGRAGVEVAGVSETYQAGCASRYLAQRLIEADPEKRLEWLLRCFPARGRDERKPALIPCSDQDVDFVTANADVLSDHFSFQASYSDGVASQIMNKESFYGLCEMHGVAYPRLWRSTCAELGRLRDAIYFPCMIKPSRIQDLKPHLAGRKGWLARDVAEFDRIVPSIPRDAGVLLLQEIVPGPESEITLFCGYFDGKGSVQQGFTARKLRQHPPGFGSASLVQSAQEEETQEITETFLRRLGYRGIAAAEFKRDPQTGILKMIEINVRPSLWFSISSRAGRPTVLAAYHDLTGSGQILPQSTQQNGVRWHYVAKDMSSALFYRLNRGFLLPPPDVNAVGSSVKRVSAVYAGDDLAPAAAESALLASKFVRRAAVRR